ncbi:MAG: ABC transporter permease [Clostridia bacterium]|nr:ABC transporter permease [Clostridia bacterium]
MTKALFRETLRSIWRTKARFVSLIAIVALGISFFAGIKAAYPDLHETAVRYYRKNNLMDVWMISTIGFTDSDVEKIKGVEGVENAAGSKFVDTAVVVDGELVSNTGGSQIICRSYGFDVEKARSFETGVEDPSYINRLTLIDGRYPQKANECLVDRNSVSTPKEFVIGNTICLEGIEESLEGKLSTTEFEIVGVIETPRYVSIERGQTTVGSGSLGCFIYIPNEAFTIPFYSEMCVSLKGVDDSAPYSEEYFNTVEKTIEKIEAISQSCLEASAEEVKNYYGKDLNEQKQKLEDGKKQIEEGLSSASQEISQGEAQIRQGEAQLASARAKAKAEFDAKYKELISGKSKYAAGLKEYNEKLQNYNKAKDIYDAAKESYSYVSDVSELKSKLEEAERVEAQLEALEADLQAAKENEPTLQAKVDTLNATRNSLASQLAQYENPPAGTVDEPAPDHSAEIAGLRAKIAEIDQEILDNKTALYNCQDNIYDLEAKITELKANPSYKYKLATQLSIGTIEQVGKELEKAEKQLKDAEQQLAKAKKTLEDGGLQLEGGWDQYNAMLAKANGEFAASESQLNSGRARLAASKSEYSQKVSELKIQQDEAQYKIDEAEKILNDAVSNRNWYVYDRNSIPGYEGYGQTAENMKAFATLFPLFFFVVAALVCLTTMTRMVDEERTQLGTLKALGYSEKNIRQKYLFYSFFASIIGSAIGLSVGLVVFPKAIFSAYSLMYNMPDLAILYPWQYMLSGTLFATFSTVSVSYVACRKEMKSVPAQLMRPKAPKAGKRILLEKIPFIWKGMNFTSKVTARNIFRNKKRFIMTLIGIGGCTALLLTGFGLSDSINAIISTQYGRNGIVHADCQIAFKNSQKLSESSDEDSVYQKLCKNENSKDVMMFHSKSVTAFSDSTDETYSVFFFVPQNNDDLKKYVVLQDRLTKNPCSLTDDGVLISEKIATKLGVSVGDNIKLKFSESETHEFPVTAIVENYTYHYVYISPALYRQTFDEEPAFNYAYVNYTDEITGSDSESVRSEAQESLNSYYEVTAVIDIVQTSESFGRMFKSLDYVIMVFIASAALLAFVVLYNLTNININERKREIATLKVLGFHNYESTSYIGRENMVITVLGTIGGLIVGIFLHRFVIEMAEVNVVMFGRTIDWTSYVWAVVLTFVFSLIVSVIMSISIKRIHMVESLKSIE